MFAISKEGGNLVLEYDTQDQFRNGISGLTVTVSIRRRNDLTNFWKFTAGVGQNSFASAVEEFGTLSESQNGLYRLTLVGGVESVDVYYELHWVVTGNQYANTNHAMTDRILNIQNQVDQALIANHLDKLILNTYNSASPPGASDSLLNEITQNDSGVTQFTENALELAPGGGGGGGLTSQDVRDAMKLAPTAGAAASGSIDEFLENIETDTGTDIPSTLSGIEGKIDTIDQNVDDVELLVNTLDGKIDLIDNNVDDIKDKTDLLPEGFKKNQSFDNFQFGLVSDSDDVTPATGITVTAERLVDGGGFVSMTNSVIEVSDGMYRINLSSADLNGNIITFKFSGSGARTRFITFKTAA